MFGDEMMGDACYVLRDVLRDLCPVGGAESCITQHASLVVGEEDEVAANYPVVEISVERRVLQPTQML